MKTRLSIFTAGLTGAGLLAAALYASAQQNAPAAPAVDPAHAAHVASGAMPPDAPAGDPALTKQLAELQDKVTQLQASLAKSAPTAAAASMPGMPAVTPPAAPPMAMGMGKMKPGGMPGMKTGAAPAPPMAGMGGSPAPAAGGMGMMGMMDKMMGMMDKMMGMGGGAAMPPAAPMAGMGMMDMDDKMEMPPMGGGAMPAAPMSGGGMGMMDMDDKMEMAAMMGMMSMGDSSMAAMSQSALPGFPGASHLYHLGATGFFLDHKTHIALTIQQQGLLNTAKEQALLAKSTADRAKEQAEQELWMLTAADQPDAAKIETKLAEIGKLSADERLAFIRAVGEASKLLTDPQRQSLTGFAPPAPAPAAAPMAAPGAAMPAGGMPDM